MGGDRDEPITTTDMHGRVASRSTRRVPVLAPAQIANLPAETVVAFRRGMPPVIGRVQMAYRRADVRGLFEPEAFDVRVRAGVVALLAWLSGRVVRPLARWCTRIWAWLGVHVLTPVRSWILRVGLWLAGVARRVLVAVRLVRRPAAPPVDLGKTPIRWLVRERPPWLPAPEDPESPDDPWRPAGGPR